MGSRTALEWAQVDHDDFLWPVLPVPEMARVLEGTFHTCIPTVVGSPCPTVWKRSQQVTGTLPHDEEWVANGKPEGTVPPEQELRHRKMLLARQIALIRVRQCAGYGT